MVIIAGRVGPVCRHEFRPTLVQIVLVACRRWRVVRRAGQHAVTRVELFEKIRRDRRVEGLSIRGSADRHRTHRRTVRQAFDDDVPPPRKACSARPRPAIDPWVTVTDAWMRADQVAPCRQRHTARRIWPRPVAERGATCSQVNVSWYVAQRRAQLGLLENEVSVPQTHEAGADAEVDFGGSSP